MLIITAKMHLLDEILAKGSITIRLRTTDLEGTLNYGQASMLKNDKQYHKPQAAISVDTENTRQHQT